LFNATESGAANISISNQLGSIVMNNNIPVIAGQNIRKIDLSKLPNGLYYVKLQYGTHIQMAKFVVNK
jgi:hypothetical protein